MDNLDTKYARVLWDFHKVKESVNHCDVIVGLGSYDMSVAIKCCELLLDRVASAIIFSGYEGNWTLGAYSSSEAQRFKELAVSFGADPDVIILEEKSLNTGQNIIYSSDIMRTHGWSSAVFVTKPQTSLRVRLTINAQASFIKNSSFVTYPNYPSMDSFEEKFGRERLYNEMVGDIERILRYPDLGYQVAINIPKKVMSAYRSLLALGFTKHTISPNFDTES